MTRDIFLLKKQVSLEEVKSLNAKVSATVASTLQIVTEEQKLTEQEKRKTMLEGLSRGSKFQ